MRVLGVTPSPKNVSWAMLEGKRSEPTLVNLESTRQKFPLNQPQEQLLQNLYKYAVTLLKEKGVEKVCILQAGKSQYGGPSSMRIKIETVFQLACAEPNINITVELLPSQRLRAQEKKFIPETGGTPENVINSGKEFKPKPWKEAVLVAWTGLDK